MTPGKGRVNAETARQKMVEEQIVARGVQDPRVLAAMRQVPRELFVSAHRWDEAFGDAPVPIGYGQTISQPYIVARTCELAQLKETDVVLDLGSGSGYQSAVLSRLCRRVYAVEIVPDLVARSRDTLGALGIGNLTLACFDGSRGWPEHAPFDAILVAAGAPRIPPLLLNQLAPGGRLVIPVGPRDDQRLVLVTELNGEFEVHDEGSVRFVDLVGRDGWGGSEPPRA